MPESLKAEVQAVLLTMGDDPAARRHLAHGFVERFAPVTDEDYDMTREMVRAAEAVGFMRIV
jgi:ABC-type phosphate/phosphonate transport system substrate-binding protein